MATRSMPTLSCMFHSNASFSLVPTPSVPEPSTGCPERPGTSKSGPNPPMPARPLAPPARGAGAPPRAPVAPGRLDRRAEAAEARQHALAQGFFGQGFDAFDQGVAGGDVDAGVFVGEGGGAHGGC